MASKTATLLGADMMNYLTMLKAAMKELAEIRRANRATDAKICHLQSSTRKKLARIGENLRRVEAAR